MSVTPAGPSHFIRNIIRDDLETGRVSQVVTRFPPEPNGYLHIGHAKSICLNFGMAEEFQGHCNLRFDDTNPAKEEQRYIDAIKDNIEWLGFTWAGEVRYTSSYFQQLYDWAMNLIEQGLAYVDEQTADEIRETRGTLTEPGTNSPFRKRSIEENKATFAAMQNGERGDGSCVLRAKIDMASPNINLRDPVLYRVKKIHHHQTGDQWNVYPMYDYAHALSDAIEFVTHSLCTLEFEDHRPLYDWLIEHIVVPATPHQYEFARLNLNYTVTSKRKLKQLVDEKHVNGWDDPRLPTIAGLRRRGYTPTAIRDFCTSIGVTKADSVVDMGQLEYSIRQDLDTNAQRRMCVLRPLKVVIENYEDNGQMLSLPNHPKDETMGSRMVSMSREIYIDQQDFAEQPPRKWKRLSLNGEVRLRGSYIIKCHEVVKDAQGNPTELRCTYDMNTLGKNPEDRKVKGVIHWVDANDAVNVEVRLYDRLFTEALPDSKQHDQPFLDFINPDSLTVIDNAKGEQNLMLAQPEQNFQFEREGYFCADQFDHSPGHPVFNLTVNLRDSWAKLNT